MNTNDITIGFTCGISKGKIYIRRRRSKSYVCNVMVYSCMIGFGIGVQQGARRRLRSEDAVDICLIDLIVAECLNC